ncbi:RNA-binding protein 42 [Dinochytrium kinnereticum]|nr:RNA-binding protein 42 [Dinochytrium kinnereticum]
MDHGSYTTTLPATTLYNPIELTMANGFVSAAAPTVLIPPPAPNPLHQQQRISSHTATTSNPADDYSAMKEVPYPEGYVPSRKKETKKEKEEKTLSRAAVMAKAQAIRMNGSRTKFDQNTKKKPLRVAGGQVWEDSSMLDWDPNDFRIFCGDLGNEVNDDTLFKAFVKYPSLQKVKVIRDKRTGKTKGFGFVSFKDPNDFVKAMKEMNGKYVGNRPIKLRKSTWADRSVNSKGVLRKVEGVPGSFFVKKD